MNESSGFRVRLDPELRQQFVDACRANDRTAAQVLRDFMRAYVAKHYSGAQIALFAEAAEVNRRNDN